MTIMFGIFFANKDYFFGTEAGSDMVFLSVEGNLCIDNSMSQVQ